jgi:hypothetical protein
MFVIPLKYDGRDYIVDLVASIRAANHEDRIVIVDSGFGNYDYIPKLHGYDTEINLVKNRHYIDGAVWWAYEHYPQEDFFYVLHDSMKVHASLERFKSQRFSNIMALEGWIHDNPEQTAYIQACAAKLGFSYNVNHSGLFGITFHCQRNVLEELEQIGLNKILPTNRIEMQGSERLWGFVLKHIGIDVQETAIIKKFEYPPNDPGTLQKFIINRS